MVRSVGAARRLILSSAALPVRANSAPTTARWGRSLSSFSARPAISASSTTASRVSKMAPPKASRGVASGYVEDLSQGRMLRFEASLPKLPVPTLAETADRYLKSVRPLLTAEDFGRTEQAVADFIRPGGPGETLQKRLEARQNDPNTLNWLADWWNESAYMGFRGPVVPYVSYFYAHRDDRHRRDPAKRAAAITAAALRFKQAVDEKTLEPEYMRKAPIAMSSYEWMFNACRVPAKPADHSVKASFQDHPYIVVVRKNQFWVLAHSVDGKPLSAAELEVQFRRIYAAASPSPAIGLLTTQDRDRWTEARARLLAAHPDNAAALDAIEKSSFVVCLDESAPVTLEERAHLFWHGDGANRWFDKPCQFIIADNGVSGFVGEHSMMDGTPTHRLNDEANTFIAAGGLEPSFNPATVRPSLEEPTAVRFVTNRAVENDVRAAAEHFRQQIGQHELSVQMYQGYGKGLIKQFGCSPDAYVQMVIQLAYHKFYGFNRPTYESAATRKFQLGRTETCRTVSAESVAFCQAMSDPSVGRAEAVKLFRSAISAHGKYITAASDGLGVDRHLFGLKKCVEPGETTPTIFTDPTFTYSSTWFVSSSQLSSEHYNGYGWSEVVDGGWGIAYMINDGSLHFNVVSKKLGSPRMSQYLREAADDMREMLLPELEKPKARL